MKGVIALARGERPKLHDAIVQVLGNRSMTYRQIAEIINAGGLYMRKDGMLVPADQVRARVRQYPHLFEVDRSQTPHLVSNASRE